MHPPLPPHLEDATTFAEDCGILLSDEPDPLFQLLVMTLLMSKRIGVRQAMQATRAVLAAGWTSPARLAASGWRERVTVLNRAGYARYDESTSRTLALLAARTLDAHAGDLRRIRGDRLRDHLTAFTGIGPVGADIFTREVQQVWPELYPYVDGRARAAAVALGLPATDADLAALVPRERFAAFVAGLVRTSLVKRRRGPPRRE